MKKMFLVVFALTIIICITLVNSYNSILTKIPKIPNVFRELISHVFPNGFFNSNPMLCILFRCLTQIALIP